MNNTTEEQHLIGLDVYEAMDIITTDLIRVWKEDTVGTSEYRPDRINLEIDKNRKVTKAWWG